MSDSNLDNFPHWWQVYIARIILAFDQLSNVFLLGFPDESISGRVGRAMMTGREKWFVPYLEHILDHLFHLLLDEDDHCRNSVEPDERFSERRELWKWYHRG